MLRRLVCLASLLAPLGVASGASAAAAPRIWQPLSAGVTSVRTDGDRWAAGSTPDGQVVVLDGSGPSLVSRSFPIAPFCGERPGGPAAVGSGYLLLLCTANRDPAQPRMFVMNLRTGAGQRAVDDAALERLSGLDGYTITGVGRRWIHVFYSGHSVSPGRDVLLGWRDGRQQSATARIDRAVDLDDATGAQKLCRGVRRPDPESTAFAFTRPLAVDVLRTPSPRLVLERCDKRPVVLTRAADFGTPALSATSVAWPRAGEIFARTLPDGRTRQLPPAPGASALAPTFVSLAGRYLFATVRDPVTFAQSTSALRTR